MPTSGKTTPLSYSVHDCPLQQKSYRLVVLLLLTITTAGTWGREEPFSTYSEDLSVHRIEFHITSPSVEKPEKKQCLPKTENFVPIYAVTDWLDRLISLQKSGNESIKNIPGYTIQVYAGASREAAFKARNKLYIHYPTLKPEIKYDLPNYVVRIGSFLDKLEAYTVYAVIKNQFPQAIVRPISFANKPCIFKQNTTDNAGMWMPSTHPK